MIFSGSSHPLLAQEIANSLKISLGKRELRLFPDGEIYVEIMDRVQGERVLLLQSFGANPNFHLMEMLIMLDALKRAAALSIGLVIPYYPYGRQNRINHPGAPITARLLADLMTRAGADNLITMDLHSELIEGFFDIPVHHLLSSQLLIPHCEALLHDENAIVVAPDKGATKIAGIYANALNLPLALIDKERIDSFHVKMRLFVGDVKGKTVVLVDDMCSTGGTLISAATHCMNLGACRVIAVIAHGLFVDGSLGKIAESPIEKLIITNTIAVPEEVRNHPKIEIVSIAPIIADAIARQLPHGGFR